MHVCHVIHGLDQGGAEHVLVDLARVAHHGAFTVSVVALATGPAAVHAQDLVDLGVPVHSLGPASRWDPRVVRRAHAVIRALAPDIVHTHLKHADLVGGIIAHRLGVPQISTLHVIEDGVLAQSRAKRWVAGRMRKRRAHAVVAVSDAQREWYLRTFAPDPTTVLTIHNGVIPADPLSPDARHAVRTSLGLEPDDFAVAMIALMRPGKGHEDLLAAVHLVTEDVGLRVLLLGDGPERARLEAQVASEPWLRDRVIFCGYRNDVPTVLRAVDLVVHPTHTDALPTAVIQALGSNTPVVASDVGGIPEILGEDAGVLVPPRDPAALAEAISSLAASPARRFAMAEQGRARFDARFDATLWARRLGDLYSGARSR